MRQQMVMYIALALALGAAVLAGTALWVALQARLAQSSIVAQVQQVVDTPDSPNAAQAEIAVLQDELDALQAEVAAVAASVSAQPAAVTKTTSKSTAANQVKEYFVYLGTGSSTSREWSDVNGTLATVDLSQYGVVKSITFEATLSIISGEVYARLKNVTTGAIYYPSQVIHNTSTSQWRSSQTFTLPAGANQYVVQLRSSNGESARLDGSRIKIVVE